MRSRIRAILLASLAVPACCVAQAALAQDRETRPADGALPEQTAERAGTIVVTARKREENLIEVPLAVTVATQEQLSRDQVYNVNDLQRITPALEISQTAGGESNGGGRLRGLGTGVFNPSVASSVALVIDQVPVGNLNFPLLYDLGQVEVLRGPQGTLFGQGASAGVLNISTRAPEFGAPSINAGVDFAEKGTAGSEVGERVVNAGVNLPLGDIAALRVATQYKKEIGLQHSVTTGRDNVIEDFGIRGRLLFEPVESLSINLNGEYGEQISNGQTFQAIAIAPNAPTFFDPDGPGPAPLMGPVGAISTAAYTNPAGCALPEISERAEFYCEAAPSGLSLRLAAVSAVIDFELSDAISLTSVTAFRDRSFRQLRRDFSRILPQAAARQERTRENAQSFSQELRLTYIGESFDVVAGGFYNDFNFDRVPTGDAPFTFGSNLPAQRIGFSVCPFSGIGFCPVSTNFTDENTQNRVWAAFADATISLSERFEVFGGLRLDDYRNTTTVRIFRASTANPPVIDLGSFVTEDTNVSGRIGVSYMPSPDVNFFGSYARGYKPPAVGTIPADPANPGGTLFQLEPEKANAFEIGAKFGLAGLQLSANAFYTELLDFQSQISVFVGTALVSRPLNIDRIESKGFELNAFGQVLPGFSLNAGYQFNDITYPDGYLGDDGGNLGGTQFLNAPRHKFTLWGDYGLELSDAIELFVNANLVYKSEVLLAARADPRFRYPAHEIVNGGLGLRDIDGEWTASVYVRNLTKEREPTAYLASTFSGVADGGIRAWPVAGLTARVVGVRFGFEF